MSTVQANNVSYELHTLGWKAYQNLIATIAAEIWGQTIQTFFDSNDGGRDGAFHGTWDSENGESYSGSFTVQCKFTSRRDAQLTASDLKDELKKAVRLSEMGLADNYFLCSNSNITGANEEIIRAMFEDIPNLKRFVVFGRERITQFIQESSRLRMLVPRIYGLGDLSQIFDQRAYAQGIEILSSLGDDLQKFVVTDAYRKSANALADKGFVFLIGEPMCGKSSIAASLSLGATDEWNCSTIKARNPDDFVRHYNPHEKQIFWIDDVFGSTQVDWSSVYAWNSTLSHLMAALSKGTKIIFTSRDYIYRTARRHLKRSTFPPIDNSQVVVRVEELSPNEREEILYNHIKLGNQPRDFKTQSKPFLFEISSQKKFSPEIARRLGNSMFTKNLSLTSHGLDDFVNRPLELLREIIDSMDERCRSALALVFIRGGVLPSPVEMSEAESKAIERLNGTLSSVVEGLESLSGSFVISTLVEGTQVWNFKHPTVRDAFAELVADSQDMTDIYISGAPVTMLFREVACGIQNIEGVKVIVPPSYYSRLIKKLDSINFSKWSETDPLCRFLVNRCDRKFMELFVGKYHEFVDQLNFGSYTFIDAEGQLLIKLDDMNLLEDTKKLAAVAELSENAVCIPSAIFMESEFDNFLPEKDRNRIVSDVKSILIPELPSMISQWTSDYDHNHHDDPEGYFNDLIETLKIYGDAFSDCESTRKMIDNALIIVDEEVESLQVEHGESEFKDFSPSKQKNGITLTGGRSIFDDVDR